jgi:hypothetical protein
VWPHFDLHAVKRPLTNLARPFLPDRWCALGIDEYTGLVGRLGGEWSVSGAGSVKLLTSQRSSAYTSGSQLTLPAHQNTTEVHLPTGFSPFLK